jgi:ATP-binding cassette subfamily B protein
MTAANRNLFRAAALAQYGNPDPVTPDAAPPAARSLWATLRLALRLVWGLVAGLATAPRTLWRRRVPVVLQMTTTECGAACLAMVLRYYGRATATDEIAGQMGIGRDGASALAIAETARGHGLTVHAYTGEPAMLAALPGPAILHWNFAHYVVLERWQPAGAVIVDPAQGRRTVSTAEFDRSFTGVLLTLTPGPTFRRRRHAASAGIWRQQLQRLVVATGAWRTGLAVLAVTLLVQALALTLPWLTQLLVDRVVPQRATHLVPLLAAGIATVVIMHMVVGLTRRMLLIRLQAGVDTQLMTGFLDHLLALPYRFFQQRTSGDLLMRLSSNTVMRELLTTQTIGAVMDGLMVVSFLAVLLVQAPVYGLVTLGIGLGQVCLLLVSTGRMHDLAQRHLTTQAEAQAYLVEALAGVNLVKATGAEQRVIQRWTALHHKALGVSLDKQQLSALIQTLLDGLQTAAPLTLLLMGAYQVLAGTLTLGQMLALNALAVGFLAPLDALVGSAQQFQTVGAHLNRLADVLGTPREDAGTVAPTLSGQIELDRVSYRYDRHSAPILREVSVSIAPGQKVAIVGRSGSGKSTLARLLMGLDDPTGGEIRFDGVPLAQMDRGALRRQIGAVLQEVFLFSGSIRQNLAFGLDSCTLEDLLEATRLAGIDRDIAQMPMDFETLVAEGGAGLSGGQRQRLALARALVRRPAILLLDEATSHLDTATEAQIQHNLAGLGCTQVIIAHRLSTIRHADLILVMDEGRIVARGTHADLLAQGGLYATLCQEGQAAE